MISSGTRRVVGRRPEVFADTLDEVGPTRTARIHRAFRVRADDAHPAVGHLLQIPARTGDGAAGTHPGDEMGHLAVGVIPDLGARRLVVADRTHRVGVLIGFPRAVDLLDETVGHAVVAVRVVGRHRRRAHHDLSAVGAQHILLVLADLVRAHEDAFVATRLGDQRQADTGVAGGRFDDRAAGLQLAAGLRGVDHLRRDAVFGAATRVEVLDLGDDLARALGHDRVQLNQRGIADELTDVPGDPHASIVSGRTNGYQVASRM